MKTLMKALLIGSLLASTASVGWADDKVVLTMWHGHPEWKNAVEKIISTYEEENPNVEIQLEEIPGQNLTARLNTALAAGEAPDLFALQLGPTVGAAGKAGQILDLTDKVDISGLTQAAQDASHFDGKVWSVPVFGSYTVGLYYQKKIFADNGLKPPANETEFMKLCSDLKAKGITPMIAPAQDGIIPAFLYMMMASSVLKADGFADVRTGKRKLTDPDVVAAAKYLQDIYPCFEDGALGTAYTEGKALFALGKGAMLEGGSADYAGFVQTNPKVDVGVVPFPAVDGGTPATVTGMQDTFSVNSKSQHPDEAIKFIQWLIGKEAAQMVADSITLSNTVGVTPSNNAVMQQMVDASHSNDVRVWYEFPETGDVFAAVQQNASALFLKQLTPEEFSAKLQAAVKPSGGQ
jgi:raffinose/stachyose/melibiose transport system substrate-binding protein